MARELGDGDVHAEADAQIRDLALARDAAGEDLSFPAARAEAAGHEHAVDLLEQLRRLLEGHPLRVDPAHAAPSRPWWTPACLSASCTDRYASCSFTYLPTSAISTTSSLSLHALVQVEPVAEIGLGGAADPSFSHDEAVEPLRLQRGRARGRRRGRPGSRSPRPASTSAKSAIFSRMSRGELLVRAADDDVGVDTDAAQLVDGVLRRLRLQLAGRLDERHERDVQVEHVLGARPRGGTGGSPRGTAATRCRRPCRRSR